MQHPAPQALLSTNQPVPLSGLLLLLQSQPCQAGVSEHVAPALGSHYTPRVARQAGKGSWVSNLRALEKPLFACTNTIPAPTQPDSRVQ